MTSTRNNRERAVRINVRKEDDDGSSGSDDEKPQHFNAMQKNMGDELEKRRIDWEKEVEKMQEEFFKTKLNPVNGQSTKKSSSSSREGGLSVPVKRGSGGGTEIFDIMNSKSLYSELPDGTRVYRVRFDVKDFEPHEIYVKADGNKLTVRAKHQEDSGSGNKTTKQFNRSVDLPHGVDPDELTSYLSGEGILSVEAPVHEMEVEHEAPDPRMEFQRHLEYDAPQIERRVISSSDYSSPTTGRRIIAPDYDSRYITREYSSSPVIERRVVSSNYSSPMHDSRQFVPSDPFVEQQHWGFSSGGNRVCQATPQSTRIWRTTRNDTPLVTQTRKHMAHNYNYIPTPGDEVTTNTYSSKSSSLASPPRSPRLKVRETTNTPEVEDTEYGKKVRLVIDIGRDYSAEDITVKLHHRKVSVKAVHEDDTGGRTSRREFSRDYDLPIEVEGRTVRASLSADNKLHIGASAKENTEHEVIIGFIIQDMPRGGKKCTVSF